MRQTPVYIICSPRPLVGKTLIARLLSEFLLLKNGKVAAFDINLKEPSLLEYLPDITETAEVDDTFGKMALMDRLIINDGVAKVIDLGFHAFDEFFKMTDEIGFMKEAAPARRCAGHPVRRRYRPGLGPRLCDVAAPVSAHRACDDRQRICRARRTAARLRPWKGACQSRRCRRF